MNEQERTQVLIVEDETLVGQTIQGLLEALGYAIAGRAMDGHQAVAMTQSLRPDVVLMDIGLPDMDGVEATQRISESCPTPVVMLTAYETPELVERATAAGAGAYLIKPADPQELGRAIIVTIARFDDMMELRRLNAALQAEIAQRKRVEEALRESEKRYRAVVEDQTELICRFQPDGTLTFVNEAYCRYFGKRQEELIGHSCMPLIPNEDREFVASQFTSLPMENPITTYEHRVLAARGEIRWQQWTDRAIFDEQGHIVEYQSVGRDITERKRAEEAIRQHNRELAALNALTSAMMQSALHLDEVLQLTADGIVQGLGCNTAFIFLLDEEEEIFKGGAVSTKAKILKRLNAIIGFPLLQIKIPARSDFNEAVRNLLDGRTTIKHNFYELVRPLLSKPVCSAMQMLLDSRTFFTLPLLAKGKTVGGIVASTQEELSEADTEKLMTFANQAAIAIENARLYEEARQRALEQETLREAALALTTALDRNRVIERILAQLQRVVPYDSASVQLLRENRMELVGGRGFPNLPDLLGASFPADGDNPNSEVIRTRAPFIVEDAPAVYEGFRKGPHQETVIYSWLGVPMLVGERLVGMIALDKSEPGFYTQEHARLAEAFAAQAAIAIENARLFEEEKRRSIQLALINEVGDKAASILDLNRLMQEVTRSIQESFNYYNVDLLLLDEKRREMVIRAVAGGFEHIVPGEYRQSIEEGIVGFVVRTGKSWLANDTSKDPYYVKGFLGEVLTRSELCVPIKLGDKVIGILDMQSVYLNDFDQSDVVAMEAVADRVAIGIENARLYEETQRHSQHLAQTLTLSELLHGGLELKQVLEQIAQGVLELGFQVAINVCEPEGDVVRVQAVTGLEGPERETLMSATYHWSDFQTLMQEQFRISHSYFIRQGELDWEKDFQGVSIPAKIEDRGPNYWRPEDSLLVPLRGTRGEPLGLLSVDRPVDGLLPDLNTIQTLEAFANQAAIAIENARLFEESEERRLYLEAVLGAAPDAIVTLDAHYRIAEWNPGAEKLFGYSREEVIGRELDPLVARADTFEEAVKFTQRVMKGRNLLPVESIRYRKDGSPVDVLLAGSPIMVGDEPIGAVAVYTDITARKRIEEALRALALLDELTGLYNRRGFSTLGQQQLKAAHRAQRSMLLLFADFDGLKQINDAFGHTEGDLALIEVANIFRHTFRESDIIARIGGDEFVVLAVETDSVSPEVLVARLQDSLEARNVRKGLRYKLSLSLGIAHYDPEHPCSIDELLAQADRAMYEQKRGSTPG